MSDYNDAVNFPNNCDKCGQRTPFFTCNRCAKPDDRRMSDERVAELRTRISEYRLDRWHGQNIVDELTEALDALDAAEATGDRQNQNALRFMKQADEHEARATRYADERDEQRRRAELAEEKLECFVESNRQNMLALADAVARAEAAEARANIAEAQARSKVGADISERVKAAEAREQGAWIAADISQAQVTSERSRAEAAEARALKAEGHNAHLASEWKRNPYESNGLDALHYVLDHCLLPATPKQIREQAWADMRANIDKLREAEARAAEAQEATRIQRHNVERVTELAADLGVTAAWPPILEAVEQLKARAAEGERDTALLEAYGQQILNGDRCPLCRANADACECLDAHTEVRMRAIVLAERVGRIVGPCNHPDLREVSCDNCEPRALELAKEAPFRGGQLVTFGDTTGVYVGTAPGGRVEVKVPPTNESLYPLAEEVALAKEGGRG